MQLSFNSTVRADKKISGEREKKAQDIFNVSSLVGRGMLGRIQSAAHLIHCQAHDLLGAFQDAAIETSWVCHTELSNREAEKERDRGRVGGREDKEQRSE